MSRATSERILIQVVAVGDTSTKRFQLRIKDSLKTITISIKQREI